MGTAKYFQQVSSKRFFVEPHIRSFAQFETWSGKRVLEVGCGIGTDAAEFARAGADYTGIELSKASLELAQQRFSVEALTGTFIEANACPSKGHLFTILRLRLP